MNTQLLKRIQLLESHYLIEPSAKAKIIIRFVDPSASSSNQLEKVLANNEIYERIAHENEEDFIGRVIKFSDESILIQVI